MHQLHDHADHLTPAANKPRGRWRLLLLVAILAILLFHGFLSTQVLMGQAIANAQPPAKIALPTLPTTSAAHTHLITPAEWAADLVNDPSIFPSIDDKIAQMIMVKLVGEDATTNEIQMVKQQHVGAVLAFGADIQNARQIRTKINTLQQNSTIPLWVATDQEGGPNVNRLVHLVGNRPSAQEMAASGDPQAPYKAGEQTAQDFAAYGFNFNLAPVVDIQEPTIFNPQLGFTREFSSDPQVIAQMANAYLHGLQQSNQTIGCIKHFPGLGASATDPHHGLPVVYKTQAELDAHEFVPYRQLLTMGNVHAIMVTHELLPKIDDTYPATLSKKITTGLLRDDLGFNGLIVTDSLDMWAIAAQYPIEQALLLAAEAGADVLMGPFTPNGVAASIQAISAAVTNGQLSAQQIDTSVKRILTLKIEQGLIPLPHTLVPDDPNAPITPTATVFPDPTAVLTPTGTAKPHK